MQLFIYNFSILPSAFVVFTVINKGQVLTHYYRIMNKTGGYTWIQTCATVVCNSKNAEEQNIICVNYVIRWATSFFMILFIIHNCLSNIKLENVYMDKSWNGPTIIKSFIYYQWRTRKVSNRAKFKKKLFNICKILTGRAFPRSAKRLPCALPFLL